MTQFYIHSNQRPIEEDKEEEVKAGRAGAVGNRAFTIGWLLVVDVVFIAISAALAFKIFKIRSQMNAFSAAAAKADKTCQETVKMRQQEQQQCDA